MNKQEILEEINKTEEHLANMKKMLEECECEYERWKPKEDDIYWYISEDCYIYGTDNSDDEFDNGKINAYNCFQTKEQAEAEAEKILVRRMLEDIARRLNKGKKIDWNSEYQLKYYIYLNSSTNKIEFYHHCYQMVQGVVYCLDKSFRDVAIQEIGEERLKKYLRGE